MHEVVFNFRCVFWHWSDDLTTNYVHMDRNEGLEKYIQNIVKPGLYIS
jgi:hypothetical protein